MSGRSRANTVHLGQFSWERANAIAGKLEEAGIVWWYKQAGTVSRILFAEWGVRLFVDEARLDEAKRIAEATPEPKPEAGAPPAP